MDRMVLRAGLAALGMVLATAGAEAHFKLLAPASWIAENGIGDPQKLAPCGGVPGNPGTPTGAVTEALGGSSLHVKLQETVYHPGHYRIALAVNSRDELPADPKPTTMTDANGKEMSMSAEIMNPVAPPVLADGLFQHSSRVDDPFETDITLPNINCQSCTLQVLEFMEQHGKGAGDFSYHHCAVLKITADPKKPIAAGWPKEK